MRKSPVIQTQSGMFVNPLNLDANLIDINDIAHSLSNQCRFGGHTRQFYSVAEHSLAVSAMAEKATKDPKRRLAVARAGLLHDASEAYLVDLPKPIKAQMPKYKEVEESAQMLIANVLGIEWPFPPEVHEADVKMLVTEMRDLMPSADRSALPEPYKEVSIVWPLSPEGAKTLFLQRFTAIFHTRSF